MIEIIYPCCGEDLESPWWLATQFLDHKVEGPDSKVRIHYSDSHQERFTNCKTRAESAVPVANLTEEFELATGEAVLARKLARSFLSEPDNSVQLRIVLLKGAFSARVGMGSPGPELFSVLMSLFESEAMSNLPTALVLGEFDQAQVSNGLDTDVQMFRQACRYFKRCFGPSCVDLDAPRTLGSLSAYIHKSHDANRFEKYFGPLSRDGAIQNRRNYSSFFSEVSRPFSVNLHHTMIRPATPNDSDFITRSAGAFNRFGPYVQVFDDMLHGNAAALRPYGVTGAVKLFVSVDNTEHPMGFIAVEWKPTVGHIHGVVVSGGFQRQGVATQLLDHVRRLAQERGIKTLECITAETENTPALNCFTNWGFRNMGYAGPYPMGQRAVRLLWP
jgi:ribosomal protein S18 acetylase RimI-like enzyme